MGYTVSEIQFSEQIGFVLEPGVVNLTITPDANEACQASEFYIGEATESPVGSAEWIGGNVTNGITKVIFYDNANGTVNVEIHHDQITFTETENFFVDIDKNKQEPITNFGCTNPNAENYNPNASIDDGSCTYTEQPPEPVYGCTSANALNYNALANIDDGSCVLPIYGCTNSNASNYDSGANVDDGSCLVEQEDPKETSFIPRLWLYMHGVKRVDDGVTVVHDVEYPDNYIRFRSLVGSVYRNGGTSTVGGQNAGQGFEKGLNPGDSFDAKQNNIYQEPEGQNSVGVYNEQEDLLFSLQSAWRSGGEVLNGFSGQVEQYNSIVEQGNNTSLDWSFWNLETVQDISQDRRLFFVFEVTSAPGFFIDELEHEISFYDFEEKENPISWTVETEVVNTNENGSPTKQNVKVYFEDIEYLYAPLKIQDQQFFSDGTAVAGSEEFEKFMNKGPLDTNGYTNPMGGGPIMFLNASFRPTPQANSTTANAPVVNSFELLTGEISEPNKKSSFQFEVTGDVGAEFIVKATDGKRLFLNNNLLNKDVSTYGAKLLTSQPSNNWQNHQAEYVYRLGSRKDTFIIPTISNSSDSRIYYFWLEPVNNTSLKIGVADESLPIVISQPANPTASVEITNSDSNLTVSSEIDSARSLKPNTLETKISSYNTVKFKSSMTLGGGLSKVEFTNSNYYNSLNSDLFNIFETINGVDHLVFGSRLEQLDYEGKLTVRSSGGTTAYIQGEVSFFQVGENNLKVSINLDEIITTS